MMQVNRLGLLLILLLVISGCETEEPAPEIDVPEVSEAGEIEPVEWTYGGATGPDAWGLPEPPNSPLASRALPSRRST